MNAAVPTSSKRPSAEKLAQFLKRPVGLWMASPNLALLSALVAAKTRPTRLFVREDCPPFVASVARILGAVTEITPQDEGEGLRAVLRECSDSKSAWGIATHGPDELTPVDWFSSFQAAGIPTIELCLGGMFQLARENAACATVTIVSLDHEAAFEGAELTALLTGDLDIADRVRRLCLSGSASSETIIDATPRGLAEDEPALLTLIESVIAREQARWAAEQTLPKPKARRRGISLAWKRVFHAEEAQSAEIPKAPEPVIAPAPRGKNPWLARLAELEDRHQAALAQGNAALESARGQEAQRAEQAQSTIDDWKSRFETERSRASAQIEKLEVALNEAQRRTSEHETNLAALEERITRMSSERTAVEQTLGAQVEAVETSLAKERNRAADLQTAKENLEKAVKSLNARREVEAQERKGESALLAKTRDDLAALEQLVQSVRDQAMRDAARVSETHAEARASLQSRVEAIEKERDDVRNQLTAALADRDRESTLRAAAASDAEKARLVLVARASQVENAQTEAVARIHGLEKQTAQLSALSTATAMERDAALALLRQSEDARAEERRQADAHAALTEREHALETSRMAAAVSDWQARFDAAAAAAIRESDRVLAQNAALIAGFEGQIVQLHKQAESTSQGHTREVASLAQQIALVQKENAGLSTERDGLVGRLHDAEGSFQEAARRIELNAAASARFEAQIEELHQRAESTSQDHERQVASLAGQIALVQKENAGLSTERDDLAGRLRDAEGSFQEAARRIELSAATAARLEGQIQDLHKRAESTSQDHERQVASLAGQIALVQKEKAGLSTERDDLAGRLHHAERSFKEAAQQNQLNAAATTRLEGQVEELHQRTEGTARDHAKEVASLALQIALIQKGNTSLQAERDDLIARLNAVEQRSKDALRQSEERAAQAEHRAALSQQQAADAQQHGAQAQQQAAAEISQLNAAALTQARTEASLSERVSKSEAEKEALERDHAIETSQLKAAVAAGEARLEGAVKQAAVEAERRGAEHVAGTAGLEEELSELRSRLEALGAEQSSKELAFEKRISVIETERTALAQDRDATEVRLREAQASHLESQRLSEKRAVSLEREKVQETARLNKLVAGGQARFEKSARASAKEATQLKTRHAAAMARLQEMAAIHKSKAEAATEEARKRAKEGASLSKQVTTMELEKALLLSRGEELGALLQQAEERHREAALLFDERAATSRRETIDELSQLNASVAGWQSRFDAAAQSAASESARVEALNAALVARLEDEVALLREQGEAATKSQAAAAAAFEERISSLDRERGAAFDEAKELRTLLHQQEKSHRELVSSTEQRGLTSRAASLEEASRLKAALAETQARLDTNVELQGRQEKAFLERVSKLEQEKAAAAGESRDLQARLKQQDEKKVEEAARLAAAVVELQSRFDASAQASARELKRLEDSHGMLVSRLQEEGRELKKQAGAAAASHGKETAALQKRVSELERERIALVEDRSGASNEMRRQEQDLRDALRSAEQRVSALQDEKADEIAGLKTTALEAQAKIEALRLSEETHREALRQAEAREVAFRQENAGQASKMQGTVQEWEARLDAAVQAAREAQRLETQHAAQVERLQDELSAVHEKSATASAKNSDDRAKLEALFRESEDKHRESEEKHRDAMRLWESRLAETGARLHDAETRLAAAVESSKTLSERADSAEEALRAALEARLEESAVHKESARGWATHRTSLEEAKVTELERAVPAETTITLEASANDEVRSDGVNGSAVDEPGDESPANGNGHDPDATLDFGTWEYERIMRNQNGRQNGKKSKVPGWLQEVARRIRRD